jgi:hypothetical protein
LIGKHFQPKMAQNDCWITSFNFGQISSKSLRGFHSADKKIANLSSIGYFSWDLVAWGGIEPPTQGFSVLCSTD